MEMHGSLFAIGDCFGAAGVHEQDARRIREEIREVLTGLVDSRFTEQDDLFPVSRACAYLLAFTILPRQGQAEDLAERLLKELTRHPDRITRQLSSWALKNRPDDSGGVRELIHANFSS